MRAALLVALLFVGSAASADERGDELRNGGDEKKPAPLIVALHCYGCPPDFVPKTLGQGDGIVPVAGGKLGGNLPTLAMIPSAHDALEVWARADRCSAPDGAGHRQCKRGAVELRMLPGGRVPDFDVGFDERLWQWLAAQRK